MSKRTGKYPPSREVDADETLPSISAFTNHFGSWSDALDAAGVSPQQRACRSYTDEELLDALRAFADEHGRPPTSTEANDPETDLPTQVPYRNRFGSWTTALEAAELPPRQGDSRSYTDDELLDSLRTFHKEHGNPPTTADANDPKTDLPTSATFVSRFENWNGALEAAGLSPSCPNYTDNELLDTLRAFAAEHGHPPTTADTDDDALPSVAAFRNHFGAWSAALEQAGFEPHTRTYTDDELLDVLRSFHTKHGRPPTSTEANDPKTDLPSTMAFQNHFGGWNAALEAAGLPPRQSNNRRYTADELIDALRAFADREGHPPTAPEANESEALPSVTAFVGHFGSWNSAIEQAGLEPRNRRCSDEELLADLRALAEAGTHPSYSAVADHDLMVSPETYRRRFGCWGDALEAAGLPAVSASTPEREADERSVENPDPGQ